ncbi:unnamed protein product [Dovyalis caffra]|uniref:Uncharacterized protein n=1 Tax=Dovyalis caffra TaxID=77055 RepID=A0AAV1QR76_9ROSI|nr:unnamed protein product [Dovyalis caffra]
MTSTSKSKYYNQAQVNEAALPSPKSLSPTSHLMGKGWHFARKIWSKDINCMLRQERKEGSTAASFNGDDDDDDSIIFTTSTSSKPLLVQNMRVLKHVGVKPISAVGSGMEASIAETNEKLITLKNVEIVVESQEEDKMQVRVELSGDETQKVFNKVVAGHVLKYLQLFASHAFMLVKEILGTESSEGFPPTNPWRRSSEVNIDDFLHSKQENLKVKENKITTTQKPEELKKVFVPGNEFGFNAVLELEKAEAETETEPETEIETEPETSS